MLHPSYTDLMNVVNSGVENGEQPTVNSRYSIVIAASKRARQLIDELGEEETAQGKCFKPLSMAVQELNSGEVKILSEDDIPEEEIHLGEEPVGVAAENSDTQESEAELSSGNEEEA